MSKTLIERLQRARQSTVVSGGRTFTVRRPTDLEMHEVADKIDQRVVLQRFVVDWGAMTEIDLGIPGGAPEPVAFDAALWAEWIADHPEHWGDLTRAVVDGYHGHKQAMGDAAKNSAPGSAA
jgi:hypothetical protein